MVMAEGGMAIIVGRCILAPGWVCVSAMVDWYVLGTVCCATQWFSEGRLGSLLGIEKSRGLATRLDISSSLSGGGNRCGLFLVGLTAVGRTPAAIVYRRPVVFGPFCFVFAGEAQPKGRAHAAIRRAMAVVADGWISEMKYRVEERVRRGQPVDQKAGPGKEFENLGCRARAGWGTPMG